MTAQTAWAMVAMKSERTISFTLESRSLKMKFTGQLGYAYALNGATEKARQILSDLLTPRSHAAVQALPVAHVYLGLHHRDRAFEWLGKSVDEQEVNLWLKTDPVYDPLRSDARFEELLRRARLK
jgi:hypothetical protein